LYWTVLVLNSTSTLYWTLQVPSAEAKRPCTEHYKYLVLNTTSTLSWSNKDLVLNSTSTLYWTVQVPWAEAQLWNNYKHDISDAKHEHVIYCCIGTVSTCWHVPIKPWLRWVSELQICCGGGGLGVWLETFYTTCQMHLSVANCLCISSFRGASHPDPQRGCAPGLCWGTTMYPRPPVITLPQTLANGQGHSWSTGHDAESRQQSALVACHVNSAVQPGTKFNQHTTFTMVNHTETTLDWRLLQETSRGCMGWLHHTA